MALRDNAIVAYAETKVMEKSDRDVWVLAGEILESLLDKTGFEKNEIDGAGDVRPDRHRRRQHVLGADAPPTCWGSKSASASRCTPAAARRRAAVARAAAAIDAGMCEVAFCCSPTPMCGAQRPQRPQLSARMDRPLWPAGPARRVRPAAAALRGEIRPRLPRAGQARGDAAQPRAPERERLRRSCACRSPSTTT